MAPSTPQVVIDGVWHALPVQQPLVHEIASQTHAPETQRWPAPHIAPAPHVHAPAVQRSARVGSQLVHALPFVPQLAALAGLHVEPEQQPLGQLVVHSAHVPPVHVPLHVWQAPPPLPHADDAVPG